MTQLLINKQDRRRLTSIVQAARSSWLGYGPFLDWLAAQLETAQALEPTAVPRDLVTMNTQVELRSLGSGRHDLVTLVYPGWQDASAGRVSIFEPVGLELLGSRVGHTLGWGESREDRVASIRRIRYQPEAAGNFEL